MKTTIELPLADFGKNKIKTNINRNPTLTIIYLINTTNVTLPQPFLESPTKNPSNKLKLYIEELINT
jgi:hypothetical protein